MLCEWRDPRAYIMHTLTKHKFYLKRLVALAAMKGIHSRLLGGEGPLKFKEASVEVGDRVRVKLCEEAVFIRPHLRVGGRVHQTINDLSGG